MKVKIRLLKKWTSIFSFILLKNSRWASPVFLSFVVKRPTYRPLSEFSVGIAANGFGLCVRAGFGAQNCQP
ncbi:MAG: hypothetical protein ACO1G5_00905, partial [Bacteroidota bacterium]